jgi:hypothetical protein
MDLIERGWATVPSDSAPALSAWERQGLAFGWLALPIQAVWRIFDLLRQAGRDEESWVETMERLVREARGRE